MDRLTGKTHFCLRSSGAATLFLLFLALSAVSARAQNMVAVLSSEPEHYRQALDGFYDSMGRTVQVVTLAKAAPKLDAGVSVAVLFGAKAALAEYPPHIAKVYCMAPGIPWKEADANSTSAFVQMMPRPQALLSKLKEIQPGMRSLAVLWTSPSMGAYCGELRKAAAESDIRLLITQVGGALSVPEALRRLTEIPDAMWLAPDPALVNASTFATLKDFSVLNRIAFYAPTDGLAEKGALASVAIGFKEIGRAAAQAAARIMEGKKPENPVYPEKIEITLNMSAAKSIGFTFQEEIVRRADRVLP